LKKNPALLLPGLSKWLDRIFRLYSDQVRSLAFWVSAFLASELVALALTRRLGPVPGFEIPRALRLSWAIPKKEPS
jgi:hypothetical protein